MLSFTLGYATASLGFFLGMVFTYVIKKESKRLIGTLMGFTAGLMISFVSFSMLPEAFLNGNLYIGILGILLGVIFSAFAEDKITQMDYKMKNTKYLKTSMILIFGVAVHNLPEGIALGSLLRLSFTKGLKFAIIIAVHCIPEAIAFCIPLMKSGMHWGEMFHFILLLSLPMGIGCLLGYSINSISPLVMVMCLCFAAGVMLYIACGEIIPESKDIWRGRLSTIGAVFGFIAGVILTA